MYISSSHSNSHLDLAPDPTDRCFHDLLSIYEYIEDDGQYEGERLIFLDNFDTFNFKKWKHDLTMSGGGNWEFQLYHNNRTNSYVKDGVLYIKPTLTADRIGESNLKMNYRMVILYF